MKKRRKDKAKKSEAKKRKNERNVENKMKIECNNRKEKKV